MTGTAELEAKYIIDTYGRRPGVTPCLVRGEGSYLFDERDKKYLDFLSGLAVNVVGHCHPEVVRAICSQAAALSHTSNLYYTVPQAELARRLVDGAMAGGKVFFANSGAEVNEAAIKLARKHREDRYKIITAEQSFHGRTMAALTATGQPKYRRAFTPVLEGFSYGRFNDLESFEALIDGKTAAILIEPIQGEGGVNVAGDGFLRGLRDLCDREELLLIFDEVQCGMGRSGKMWAFENWGVQPDLFTAAKGLGGGLPIGALVVSEPFSGVFEPGDHASTFGGNPVVCSAALAVLDIIEREGFLESVQEKGRLLRERFEKISAASPGSINEIRGVGLICAIELSEARAKEVQQKCTAEGLLINAIGEKILRLLPPLTVDETELNEGLQVLERCLGQ